MASPRRAAANPGTRTAPSSAKSSVKPAAKRPARRSMAKTAKAPRRQYLDTVLEVGAAIDFPGGETLRVTRIEGDTITLEKTP